jgi:hypothetical protein
MFMTVMAMKVSANILDELPYPVSDAPAMAVLEADSRSGSRVPDSVSSRSRWQPEPRDMLAPRLI